MHYIQYMGCRFVKWLQGLHSCSDLEHRMLKCRVTWRADFLQDVAGRVQKNNWLDLPHSVFSSIPQYLHMGTVCLSTLCTVIVYNVRTGEGWIAEFRLKFSPAERSNIISCNSCQPHCELNLNCSSRSRRKMRKYIPVVGRRNSRIVKRIVPVNSWLVS